MTSLIDPESDLELADHLSSVFVRHKRHQRLAKALEETVHVIIGTYGTISCLVRQAACERQVESTTHFQIWKMRRSA